jgi:hypothetical protein
MGRRDNAASQKPSRGLDPLVHPDLDRLIDSAREVWPPAEAHLDLIGEVPAVPAIEEAAEPLQASLTAEATGD